MTERLEKALEGLRIARQAVDIAQAEVDAALAAQPPSIRIGGRTFTLQDLKSLASAGISVSDAVNNIREYFFTGFVQGMKAGLKNPEDFRGFKAFNLEIECERGRMEGERLKNMNPADAPIIIGHHCEVVDCDECPSDFQTTGDVPNCVICNEPTCPTCGLCPGSRYCDA
jgi:hypothetical protein